jgi:hypothetical protein
MWEARMIALLLHLIGPVYRRIAKTKRKRGIYGAKTMREYGIMMLPVLLVSGALAEPQEGRREPDRFAEYAAVQEHVPHEKVKTWPVGDKIGLNLLVKRAATDKQLAELVRWYVSVGAVVIFIYDDRRKAEKGEAMVATYLNGKLERQMYTWHHNGDLKDWKTVQISLEEVPLKSAK